MALLFCEGFDKYGPANSNSTGVAAMLTAGEWTSSGAHTYAVVAPLSATGQALQINNTSTGVSLSKTLSGNYARLIGGARLNGDMSNTNPLGITFLDTGTAQCSITLNGSAGTFSLRNGAVNSATIIATSTASISANTTHYLEWDITFSNTGAYQIWLDGVSILSGTGDTTATANNYANGFGFSAAISTWSIRYDDLYLFDSTGTTNNAVLLTSPRVETSFPTSDSAVQFGFGAAILGSSVARASGGHSSSANQFRVRAFTPAINMTLNSISFMPSATNASIQLRPVVYGDSAGAPGTLLSAGSTTTGVTSGTVKTMPLTTPQVLTAGTRYWLGLMCDIVVSSVFLDFDAAVSDRIATSTFASGAPGTAPAVSNSTTTVMWGDVTGTGVNYYEANQQPPPGINSYVLDATVNHEDLYNMTPLSLPPAQVYAVAVKAYCAKSDAGTKTVSMRMKSGATDSGGSLTGQAMGTSFAWLTSLFERDPNGNIAWTGANLNAAQCGFKVDS